LKPGHCGPVYGKPSLFGTRSDQFPHRSIMTVSQSLTRSAQCHELNFGWCLLEGAPSRAHSLTPLSHPVGRYGPSLYRAPWPDGQPMPSPLLPLTGFLWWSLQGVDLPGPLYRLHRHSQSQILMMTGRLDLLWPPKQPGSDRLYPEQDPNPSPLAH
jgi:hypothetical protein